MPFPDPGESRLISSPLMVTGKGILPPKVPSTSVAFGRGMTTVSRKKSQQQQSAQSQQHQATSSSTTTTATKSSIIRRSGSVGQLAESSRKGLLPGTTSTSVFNTTNQQQRCQCRNGACKCVPSMAFLEGVYVQNLQTQIEVLELENAYLRGATERGPFLTKRPTASSMEEHRRSTKTTSNGIPAPAASKRHSAGIQTEEEYRREEDEELEEEEFAMQRREDRFNRADHSSKKDKRVGFREEERIGRDINDEERHGNYVGPEENGYFYGDDGLYKTTSRWKTATTTRDRLEEDEELFQKESRLKEAEIGRLKAEKEELERRLRVTEGRMSGERRGLLAENVELQRRLEGLTPLLAEKESRLLKLEQELETANGRLKSQLKQLSALEERARESQMHGTERERAEQRLKSSLELTSRELEVTRAREASLENELADVRTKLEQREANWRREEQERQRTLQQLNEELREVGDRLNRADKERGQLETQLSEVRQRDDLLEMELELARDKATQHGEDTLRELNAKQREWQMQEAEHRSALARTQRELEALQALSQSLANENKGLREERVELDERMSELRERFRTREGRIRRVDELLSEFLEKYRLSSSRLRQQLGRQAEECEDFEQIVHKVRQMTSSPVSPPPGTFRPSTTTSSSNSPSQLSSKAMTTKRSLGKTSSSVRTKSD